MYSLKPDLTNIELPVSIHVEGAITTESSNKFIDELNQIAGTKQHVIPIIINSNGGSVMALNRMIDAIESVQEIKPVATLVNGAAMSAAAILAAAGTKGLRYAGDLSDFLVHEIIAPST